MKYLSILLLILTLKGCWLFEHYNGIDPEQVCEELDTAQLFNLKNHFEFIEGVDVHVIESPLHLQPSFELEVETWYSTDTIDFDNYQLAFNVLSSTLHRHGGQIHVSSLISPNYYKKDIFKYYYQLENGLMIHSRSTYKSFLHIVKLDGCKWSAFVIFLKGKQSDNGEDVS